MTFSPKIMLLAVLLLGSMLLCQVLAAEADASMSSSPAPMESPIDASLAAELLAATAAPTNTDMPFENLAHNLPEAFNALEVQFSDANFRSMLTSQLENPHAVEMFQSLIHDSSAINSISSLLDDPKVQSSLSKQFVADYLSPTVTDSLLHAQTPQSAEDVLGSKVRNNMESASSSNTNIAATTRPRAFVISCLLMILLSALAPA